MPDIILAVSKGCPHCPAVKQALANMVTNGDINSFDLINIHEDEARVEQYKIRSVPWLKIGPFILYGAHSQSEIKHWYDTATDPEGIKQYISDMLDDGNLNNVLEMLRLEPELIKNFIPLIQADDSSINVRLGIGAILEDLAGSSNIQVLKDDLSGLLKHNSERVRGDAAHFISLLHDKQLIPTLVKLKDDPNPGVREVSLDSIEYLESL